MNYLSEIVFYNTFGDERVLMATMTALLHYHYQFHFSSLIVRSSTMIIKLCSVDRCHFAPICWHCKSLRKSYLILLTKNLSDSNRLIKMAYCLVSFVLRKRIQI